MSTGVFIVAARRAPIGKLGGAYAGVPAARLGADQIGRAHV